MKGIFPISLVSKDFIVSIHKLGSHIGPNNYKGICISSKFLK